MQTNRVATGLEKSGKFDFFSRSGNCQGILKIGQGKMKFQKVREKSGKNKIPEQKIRKNQCLWQSSSNIQVHTKSVSNVIFL